MDNNSDASYQSESEFYYGDECENNINTGNIGYSEDTEDNAELSVFGMTLTVFDICQCI